MSVSTDFKIIDGSLEWADRYKEFCRQCYQAAYTRPEAGITANLFSKETFSSERITNYFRDVCKVDDDHHMWLAIDKNDKILGGVAAQNHKDYCEMKSFYVSPEYQGQGIGHTLYQKVLQFASGMQLQVDVIEYMTETIEMYEHWGFKVDKSREAFSYNITEWPASANKVYKAIYMIKAG